MNPLTQLFDEHRRDLQARLALRLLSLALPMAVLLLLLRLDRGPLTVGVISAVILSLLAGFWLSPQARYNRTYGLLLAGVLGGGELISGLAWKQGGLPPVLALLGTNGLLLQLCWGPAAGSLGFAFALLTVAAAAWRQWPLDVFSADLGLELGLAVLGLQATAWAYQIVYGRLWRAARRQQLRVETEAQARDHLFQALLDNLEAPLRWSPAGPDDFGRQAVRLRQGLDEVRRLREALGSPAEDPQDLGTARRLLLPLLGVGIVLAGSVGAHDWLSQAPNAWIGLALTAVLAALMGLLQLRPDAWTAVAGGTLGAAAAAISLGVATTPAGQLSPALAFGSVLIAFAALWLGLASAVASWVLLVALLLWGWTGRGVSVELGAATMAVNYLQQWTVLALFLAPAAQDQHQLLRRLDGQRQQLAASLRVRRRLLGTLFHDAANHVMALNALADLGQGRVQVPEDQALFLRIHGRLSSLVHSARRWLFSDDPFDAPALERLDLGSLGPAMQELFRSRLLEKRLGLSLDIPPSLLVRAVPDLLADGVLGNLVSNAVKFSPRGASIRLKAWQQDGWACLAVQDQGPGFGRPLVEAFEDGEELGTRLGTAGEAGLGLGLSLAREHLRRMGGRLELVPAGPAGGGEARLWLPLL